MYVKLHPSKIAPFCISIVSARRISGPIFSWDHKFTVICCKFWCHILDTGSPCLGSVCLFVCFLVWQPPQWARVSSCTRFLDHTQWRITVSRTPLDKWSAHHKDLYLTTHNTHNRQMSMSLVVFEPTTPAGEWLQTYALDRAATGTGRQCLGWRNNERIMASLFIRPEHVQILHLGCVMG